MNPRDLATEARAWLDEHGPSTALGIATGIRARYDDVRAALQADGFQRAHTPPHGNPRAFYWEAAADRSRAFPSSPGMTDTEFLRAVLSDGGWHELNEILARSFRERGCGLTVHSRASDLRGRGLRVEQRTEGEKGRRRKSFYRLVLVEAVTASNPRSTRTQDRVPHGGLTRTPRDGAVAASTSTTPAAGEACSRGDAPLHVSPVQLGLIPTQGRGAYDEPEAA